MAKETKRPTKTVHPKESAKSANRSFSVKDSKTPRIHLREACGTGPGSKVDKNKR